MKIKENPRSNAVSGRFIFVDEDLTEEFDKVNSHNQNRGHGNHDEGADGNNEFSVQFLKHFK